MCTENNISAKIKFTNGFNMAFPLRTWVKKTMEWKHADSQEKKILGAVVGE